MYPFYKMDDHVSTIIRDGVVVIPLLDKRETTLFRESFVAAQLKFPEFLHDAEAEKLPYVMGGFGGYGNPSSFHNAFVRTLRLYTVRPMVKFFKRLAKRLNTDNPIYEPSPMDANGKWFFLMVPDGMCLRPKGSSVSSESPHRDLNPQIVTPLETNNAQNALKEFLPNPYDYVFGGWINLDDSDTGRESNQYFSCVKGSHKDHITLKQKTGSESGFATEEAKKVNTDKIVIPPGHIVIFFQRILHIVTPRKIKVDSFRQFRIWRITHALERPAPLNGWSHMMKCVKDFAVPLKPSSQFPPMYSKNHASCFLFKDTQNDPIFWSKKKVKDVCMDVEKTCKGKMNNGKVYQVVKRFMPSLKDLNLHSGVAPYELFEVDWMYPNRKWYIPRNMRLDTVEDVMKLKLLKRVKRNSKTIQFSTA